MLSGKIEFVKLASKGAQWFSYESFHLRVATNFDEIVDFILFTTEQNTCGIKETTELEWEFNATDC